MQDSAKGSDNTLSNIFKIDRLRISKLLHYCQSSIVMFVLAFVFGTLLNKLFVRKSPYNNFELISLTFVQLSLNTIVIYYLKKISFIIPFKLSLTDKYIPALHNEPLYGGLVGSGLILLKTQSSLYEKIDLCIQRFSF